MRGRQIPELVERGLRRGAAMGMRKKGLLTWSDGDWRGRIWRRGACGGEEDVVGRFCEEGRRVSLKRDSVEDKEQ